MLVFIKLEVAMGRFYFHLRDGDELLPDDEGVDLPDFSAAKREAVLALQLFFCFEVRALSGSLVSSTPE